MREQIDTVIVGGGQAGLSASYYLSRLDCQHIILERGRIGESWRSERWDSLMFQFPNWAIRLPGHSYQCKDPDGFVPRDKVVHFLEEYARLTKAPVRCGIRVTSIQRETQSGQFLVDSDDIGFTAKNVVVAIGSFHQPLIPAFHSDLPRHILQIHSRDYRNPGQLPPGAVLVVGGGASGAQIAEELHESGREVYFSIGRYRRTPRRYRGRDIYWWFGVLKIWDRPVEQFPEVKQERFPLVTGVGGGRNIDLRRFAADGIKMLGRLRSISAVNWVNLPVLDDSGEPLQQRGVSPCPGFYFLGLRRMHTMKSNIFEGVGDDAAYIAEHLATR